MTTKKRWMALLLTLETGLGHFYIGEYKKALLFALSKFVILFSMFYLLQDIRFFVIVGILLYLGVWIYAFIDVWRSFPIEEHESLHYSRWYYVLLFAILLGSLNLLWSAFAPIKTFSMPSNAMNRTLFVNDLMIANRETEVKRNDVVIFKYPLHPETFYIKRLVAKGGDEVIYVDGALLIHFSEGDAYISNNYNAKDIQKYRGKLWVKNPYMIKNKNIHYTKTEGRGTLFQLLLQQNFYSDAIAMKSIYIQNKSLETYTSDGQQCNALYIKIKEGSYFMVGDNRENSHDSRFWGEVDQQYIFGVAKVVYFNYMDLSRMGREIR